MTNPANADETLIARFNRGELEGPVLEVAIEDILGDPLTPGSYRAVAHVMATEPRLCRRNGSPIPCGSPITVRIADRLPGCPLLSELILGGHVGSSTIVTLFEVSLVSDTEVAARGYAVL